MTYIACEYFCSNQDCTLRNKIVSHKKGYCLSCSSKLERIKYCPKCESKGRPYQNHVCYKCGRFLVDHFKED